MADAVYAARPDILVRGRLVRTARLRDEWYQDVPDPPSFVTRLRRDLPGVDLFTFWQRPMDVEPRFSYHMEWHPVAILAIRTYESWFETQINKGARYAIRTAAKKGVEVRTVAFDDELVRGIKAIYDERPVRQGKPFPHYGKPLETVKRENATYLERSEFLGAYHADELIGFIKLTYMEDYADPMQIIAKVSHREKSPMNALVAHAVKVCAARGIPHLFYGDWHPGGLADFKRNNGFTRLDVPRYYVPLRVRGRLALRLGVHAGVRRMLPEGAARRLLDLRTKHYEAVRSLRRWTRSTSRPVGSGT